ncbi:hypothetical protein RvY_17674 [Ramazzottius varieornatus]|uniref:Uncharacterized protein n=1 Tax=Ramazzottius varieornatus TaxID=947166 RepID=A0A1D1W8Q2_RAMVA|nr:hypothetical protein RvY_17674 [Ramazzottius varieornatus]
MSAHQPCQRCQLTHTKILQPSLPDLHMTFIPFVTLAHQVKPRTPKTSRDIIFDKLKDIQGWSFHLSCMDAREYLTLYQCAKK